MLPEAEDKMAPRAGAESPGPRGRLSNLAKGYARGAIEHLKIWHERQSLKRELSNLDDTSLSDLGLTRAQIPIFVSAYPLAGELLDLMLARLDLAGGMASMLHSTYADLLRTCSMCSKRGQCKRWLASGKIDEGYKDFCSNSWVLDQLR
ncbi:MAG TPA: DUF6455 family protein, partial [Alphaproteobacteria bacterium]